MQVRTRKYTCGKESSAGNDSKGRTARAGATSFEQYCLALTFSVYNDLADSVKEKRALAAKQL